MDTPEPEGHPKAWEPPEHPAAGVEWVHHFQLRALPLAQHLVGCGHHHSPAIATATVLPQLLTQPHSSSHRPNRPVTSGVSPPAGLQPHLEGPTQQTPLCELQSAPSCVSPQIPTIPTAPTLEILNKAALSPLSLVSVPRLSPAIGWPWLIIPQVFVTSFQLKSPFFWGFFLVFVLPEDTVPIAALPKL